jgi:hypothetical protein
MSEFDKRKKCASLIELLAPRPPNQRAQAMKRQQGGDSKEADAKSMYMIHEDEKT